mmetsp:Transcript_134448/g.287641  ORF Transcript_134448/g.287641 Transcript_134448/m.287641 type:complete len:517 (-) Transcript_134448:74-1624(-)
MKLQKRPSAFALAAAVQVARVGGLELSARMSSQSDAKSHILDADDSWLVEDPSELGDPFSLYDLDVRTGGEAPGATRHPFWQLEGFRLRKREAYTCSLILFAAGVLCSAGGIGGGGIYVTVMMVTGELGVGDAVPLSKAVVFFGSISSLVLNLRKIVATKDQKAPSLIDFNICRIVVPSALIGTYLGVALNRILPNYIILLMLCAILVFMTIMVARETHRQYKKEQAQQEVRLSEADAPEVDEAGGDGRHASGKAIIEASDNAALTEVGPGKSRSPLTTADVWTALFMLAIVVSCSVFRFHSGACLRAKAEVRSEVCNHPVFFWLGTNTMEVLMSYPMTAFFLRASAFIVPLCSCLVVLASYSRTLVNQEGWTLTSTSQYSLMATVTGCLAGLVGIGGGLIFSPFFLLMGVDPAIAVATSSTCVIFTSSSTTMQYLLTDRVIMSLTILFGIVNLLASWAGTKATHFLQDSLAARRSYISGIVLLGVLMSTVLCCTKLVTTLIFPHVAPLAAAEGVS